MMSTTKRTFFIPPSEEDYAVSQMFLSRGWRKSVVYKDTDIVVFTGGEDVTPFLYGESRLQSTMSNYKRDLANYSFIRSLRYNAPKVGICRGGQLLNVYSGGSMYQDVNAHGGRPHDVKDLVENKTLRVSSTHHQMMLPSTSAIIVAVAQEATRKETFDYLLSTDDNSDRSELGDDYEVLYYGHSNSLCFQPHPEFTHMKDCTKYFFSLIDRYLTQNE